MSNRPPAASHAHPTPPQQPTRQQPPKPRPSHACHNIPMCSAAVRQLPELSACHAWPAAAKPRCKAPPGPRTLPQLLAQASHPGSGRPLCSSCSRCQLGERVSARLLLTLLAGGRGVIACRHSSAVVQRHLDQHALVLLAAMPIPSKQVQLPQSQHHRCTPPRSAFAALGHCKQRALRSVTGEPQAHLHHRHHVGCHLMLAPPATQAHLSPPHADRSRRYPATAAMQKTRVHGSPTPARPDCAKALAPAPACA